MAEVIYVRFRETHITIIKKKKQLMVYTLQLDLISKTLVLYYKRI